MEFFKVRMSNGDSKSLEEGGVLKVLSLSPMKYKFSLRATIALFVLALIVLVSSSGCGVGHSPSGKIKVACSIYPLADFCLNVGGEDIEVETLVPSGADPHTYEPTASQIKFLSEARLLVTNGLGLEDWVTQIARKAGNPNLHILVTGDFVPESKLIPFSSVGGLSSHEELGEGHGKGEHKEVYDPHVWLDPTLALYQVKAIRDALAKIDPGNGNSYTKNASAYLEKLSSLDRRISRVTRTFSQKAFAVLHPAWTYFARHYGLNQACVAEESPGREPGAERLSRIVERIKQLGIRVIFTEPQISKKSAEVIASEAGKNVLVRTLDPLGSPKDSEVSTYIKMMEHNLRIMEEAMK